MPQSRIGQSNNLDLIRTLLALGVLTYHSLLAADIRIAQFPWVPAFIAISGFLITESMQRSAGYAHFAFKRLLRVGPGFLVSLLLVAVLGGDVAGTLVAWATMGIRSIGSNPPIWSLGVEELLYFMLAVWFAIGAYRTPTRAVIFLSLLFATLVALSLIAQAQVFTILRAALAFVCGSALFMLRDSLRWSPLAGAACLFLAFWLRNWADIHSWAQILLTGPAVAYGVVSLGVYAKPVFAKYKQLIGDPSYGIYLYHWPLMVFLQERGFDGIGLTVATVASSFILALLSWHLLEKRMLGLKDSRFSATAGVSDGPARALPTSRAPDAVPATVHGE